MTTQLKFVAAICVAASQLAFVPGLKKPAPKIKKASYLQLKRLVPLKGNAQPRWVDILTSPSGAHVDATLEQVAKLPNTNFAESSDGKMVCWDNASIAQALFNQLGIRKKVLGGPACVVRFGRFVTFDVIEKSLHRFLHRNLLLPQGYAGLKVTPGQGLGGNAMLVSKPGKRFVPLDASSSERDLEPFITDTGIWLPSNPNHLKWRSGRVLGGQNNVYLEINDASSRRSVLGRFQLVAEVLVKDNQTKNRDVLKTLNQIPGYNGVNPAKDFLVKKGERVSVQFKLRSIQIDLYAKALEAGRFGDEITIEASSRDGRYSGIPKRLKAKVVGAAKVVLKP